MRLTLVLDTTAVLAFTRGSLSAGELLDELAGDNELFGVPDVCIAHARAQGARLDGLRLLQSHEGCQVLSAPAPEIVGDVAAMCEGDLVRATVLVHAISHDAYILTTEPAGYLKLSIVAEADIVHLTDQWPD